MTVAIHQPNFLPWMGFFYKISLSDAFVIYDTAQYTQPSYIRRVKIHQAKDFNLEKYLIVNLQKHSSYASIDTLKLATQLDWQAKIKAQIHHAYHKAPFYFQIHPILDVFFSQPLDHDSFATYTSELVKFIAAMLQIEVTWDYASNMEITEKGGLANIQMVKVMGGDKYISGYGARKYQIDKEYEEAGIELIYSGFRSTFEKTDIPSHFQNKSIISYLAYYEVGWIKENLLSKT